MIPAHKKKDKCVKEKYRLVSILKHISKVYRGGSRAAATSKMECFVIIVNGFQPLTIVTKHSILDVAAVLDPPLVYRKLLYNQHYSYFDNFLFSNQSGFRKGHSAQQCLLVMIEKLKEAIERGHEFGALSTDLSKAFDCIDHKLLS